MRVRGEKGIFDARRKRCWDSATSPCMTLTNSWGRPSG